MLALKTGAKVIPTHISGVVRHKNVYRGILARHRARVRFGPPVDLSEFAQGKPDRATWQAASEKIFAAIQALAPDQSRDRQGADEGPSTSDTGPHKPPTESTHEPR